MSKTLREKILADTGCDHLSPISIARDRRLKVLYEKYVSAPDTATKAAVYDDFKAVISEEYCERDDTSTTNVD
jgi:hypothetical protein